MSGKQISNARSAPLHCTYQSDRHVTHINQVQFTIKISGDLPLTKGDRKTSWGRLISIPRPDRQCGTAYNDIRAIRKRLKQAKRLVFTGFAFHPMNMELVIPSSVSGEPLESRVPARRAQGRRCIAIKIGSDTIILNNHGWP